MEMAEVVHFLESLTPRSSLYRLRKYIEEMRRRNFHTIPRVVREMNRFLEFEDKEEMMEVLTALKKYVYTLKSRYWTYERAVVALHAIEYYRTMERVGGFDDVKGYLPIKGDYLVLGDTGYAGYVAFHRVRKMLREKGFRHAASLVWSSLSVRKAGEWWEEILKGERELVENYEEVMEYYETVTRMGIEVGKLLPHPDKAMRLLERLEEKGFLEEDGSVREELLQGVRIIRAFRVREMEERSKEIAKDVVTRWYERVGKGGRGMPSASPWGKG